LDQVSFGLPKDVAKELPTDARDLHPRAMVFVIGSATEGLSMITSDIDMLIYFLEEVDPYKALYDFSQSS